MGFIELNPNIDRRNSIRIGARTALRIQGGILKEAAVSFVVDHLDVLELPGLREVRACRIAFSAFTVSL